MTTFTWWSWSQVTVTLRLVCLTTQCPYAADYTAEKGGGTLLNSVICQPGTTNKSVLAQWAAAALQLIQRSITWQQQAERRLRQEIIFRPWKQWKWIFCWINFMSKKSELQIGGEEWTLWWSGFSFGWTDSKWRFFYTVVTLSYSKYLQLLNISRWTAASAVRQSSKNKWTFFLKCSLWSSTGQKKCKCKM